MFKKETKSLVGKTFIVTGANRGFGYAIAETLVERHATVIMACRDSEKAYQAISKLRLKTATGNLNFVPLDLTSFDSIVNFATVIKQTYPDMHGIINNAAVKVEGNEYSKENFEINFATNYLGHFILIQLLRDYIEQNATKIVLVSSRSHHKGTIDFNNFGKCVEPHPVSPKSYYRNSKVAILYLAGELYRRGYDVHVTCPDDEFTEMFKGYRMKWHDYIFNHPSMYYMMKSSEETVGNIIYCATKNVNNERKNPLNGWLMINKKHVKSKIFYSEIVSKRLYEETLQMCERVLTLSNA